MASFLDTLKGFGESAMETLSSGAKQYLGQWTQTKVEDRQGAPDPAPAPTTTNQPTSQALPVAFGMSKETLMIGGAFVVAVLFLAKK